MDPERSAGITVGFLMIGVGLWMALFGYRIIYKPGSNASYDRIYESVGPMMKFCGPLGILLGLHKIGQVVFNVP